ncbi:MAG: hypothetical protein OEM49_01525 [Myxococcales bacterium]|nr:hypothetical protein [Myxococcales bacterium]MDH5305633.1 hypothetical protein [Myxococcales bacterium]MDH5565136.1 hypothetical protein [Myxococcales bacterium]
MSKAARAPRALLLLLSAAFAAAPTWARAETHPAQASGWQGFDSAEGGFRVLLPAEPQVVRSTRRTVLGSIQEVRFATALADTEMAVELRDLPRIAVLLLSSAGILNRARDALLEAAGGRLIDADDAPRGGHPARSLRYEIGGSPPRRETALLVLLENRLYIALATWPVSSEGGADAARFLDSFEIRSP